MNKLNELIKKFENDESWNTTYKDGSKRFDEKLVWLREMVMNYADTLKMDVDDVVDMFEEKRNYSWPNYYQEANFPKLDESCDVFIFETVDDFKSKYSNFKCPQCGNIYSNPQECEHRIKNDGVCDWVSYGLIPSPFKVIIKSNSLTPIAIFEPVIGDAKITKTLKM